eukprot:TRINITY_DN3407_c0_g1_i2.p2 TRINITY_DN3407_c0_g1~~TRINITY_DN3407_c0_g1_i2.p2  ORF type:complete len:182 (-),score=13.25 TRINITY_DN3407_c0_g1_i2:153-698(-)
MRTSSPTGGDATANGRSICTRSPACPGARCTARPGGACAPDTSSRPPPPAPPPPRPLQSIESQSASCSRAGSAQQALAQGFRDSGSADLGLEALASADLGFEALASADLGFEALASADVEFEALASADVEFEALASADLEFEALDSADSGLAEPVSVANVVSELAGSRSEGLGWAAQGLAG